MVSDPTTGVLSASGAKLEVQKSVLVAVTRNMTGVRFATDAVNVLRPGVEPTVHTPGDAIPESFVVTVDAVINPPPVMTNVTPTPATGSAFLSATLTDGAGETAVPTSAVAAGVAAARTVVGRCAGAEESFPPHPTTQNEAVTAASATDERSVT